VSDPATFRPLTLADVLDLRAYERARDDYRRAVTEMKRRRRVALGPVMTLLFESFDTVRFQVHEMARAERILSDEGLQAELDVYNRLLPAPGELSATLFIELVTEEELRHWLPRLVGIERALGFELAVPPRRSVVRGVPEAAHADQLTREAVTAAVHYLRFSFSPDEVAAFGADPVVLFADHPEYGHRTALTPEVQKELVGDLRGTTVPLPLG